MSLTGKTVIIVGGTSGFGLHIAEQLLHAGARLIITGRDAQKLTRVLTMFRTQSFEVQGYVFDAAQRDQIPQFFDRTGPFDHLISMAGGFMGGGFLDAPMEVIARAVDEKLYANLAIARAARPHLKAGGSMVFTAGAGGKPHNASGAIIGNDAIRTLVQGLAVEVAPHGRVNAVAPTWTPTPLWRHMPAEEIAATERHFAGQIPLGRTASLAEIASAYLFLLENTFITGQTITVDGGLSLV
jgi:NAD(P)-dependent dehydrogenase (short-subunit alcohol dehydrogenase family)